MECFCKIATLNEVRKAFEKFPHLNGGAMQIEKSFSEDGNGDDATSKNRPHEQAAFLDVINHARFLVCIVSRGKRPDPNISRRSSAGLSPQTRFRARGRAR